MSLGQRDKLEEEEKKKCEVQKRTEEDRGKEVN